MKYKTSDLAKVLGVTTNTIRRYEKNGYVTPEQNYKGYRGYTQGDILRIGLIRMLRKCGFTHSEIESLNNNTNEGIREIAQNKLDEIDREMLRLKHLRHWLKDNIQLMDTCKNIGKGFVIMDCPPVYYVLYSSGEKLLVEKERLKTITDFMYVAPEVQNIMLYRLDELKIGNVTTNLGWAIKEMDIERHDLHEMFSNNKFIEYYPMQKCIYGVFSYPSVYLDAPEKQVPYITDFNSRKSKFMQENGFYESGDTMLFFLGSLGKFSDWLVCIPVKEQ